MSNATPILPPYFDNLRELMRHAENLAERDAYLYYDAQAQPSPDARASAHLYERDALENFIGEASCVIAEARKRIRYLETVLAEDL